MYIANLFLFSALLSSSSSSSLFSFPWYQLIHDSSHIAHFTTV